MLSRANRLSGYRNFEEVKKEGKVFQSQSFGISFRPRGDSLPPRFGFVISGKVSKEATKRNRVKRALREAVRASLPKIKEGFDIIFLVKQKLVSKTAYEIEAEVKSSLENSGLTK